MVKSENLVKKLVWLRGAQKSIVSWVNKHLKQVALTILQRTTIVYEKHVQNKDLSVVCLEVFNETLISKLKRG